MIQQDIYTRAWQIATPTPLLLRSLQFSWLFLPTKALMIVIFHLDLCTISLMTMGLNDPWVSYVKGLWPCKTIIYLFIFLASLRLHDFCFEQFSYTMTACNFLTIATYLLCHTAIEILKRVHLFLHCIFAAWNWDFSSQLFTITNYYPLTGGRSRQLSELVCVLIPMVIWELFILCILKILARTKQLHCC